jgi:hypothetical protein
LFQGADFSTATIIANRQPWASTSLTIPARLGTYYVKTVDTFGNVSEASAMAITPTATLNDDIELMRVEEQFFTGELVNMDRHSATAIESEAISITGLDPIYPFEDGAFPFVKADLSYDTIDYDANGDFPFYRRLGAYDPIVLDAESGAPFYVYDVTYKTEGIYNFKQYIDLFQIQPVTFSSFIEAEAIVDGVPMDPALAGEQYDAWFEIRSADNAKFLIDWPILTKVEPSLLFSGASFGAWRRFYASEHTGRFFQFRLLVASKDPKIGVRIKRAYVDVSARVRVDGDWDVACPDTGIRITFEPPYYETPALGITQDSAQEGDRAVVYAKDRFGFNLAFVNKDGVDVARQFDWIARGFGREEQTVPPSGKSTGRWSASPYMRSFSGDNNNRGKL